MYLVLLLVSLAILAGPSRGRWRAGLIVPRVSRRRGNVHPAE